MSSSRSTAAVAVRLTGRQLRGQVPLEPEARHRRRLDGERLEHRPVVGAVQGGGLGHRSSSGDQDADASAGEDGGGRLVELGIGDDDVELVETAGVGE